MQGVQKRIGNANLRGDRMRAFTLFEVIIAAALLAMLLTTSVQMLRALSNSQRASQRRAVALEAVQVVSDQIANIPWNELATQTAQKISIPEALISYLPVPRLVVAVDRDSKTNGKRIHVELTWNGPDGPVVPALLTTWVYPEPARSE